MFALALIVRVFRHGSYLKPPSLVCVAPVLAAVLLEGCARQVTPPTPPPSLSVITVQAQAVPSPPSFRGA